MLRVVQALPKDGAQVEVGQEQVLLELLAPGQDLASFVQDHTAAVKDQLVLPADEVAKGHKDHVVGGTGDQHAMSE